MADRYTQIHIQFVFAVKYGSPDFVPNLLPGRKDMEPFHIQKARYLMSSGAL
jgi:hypothetical protein